MSKAMVKNSVTGKWEDRSVELLHGLTVAHYTKIGLYDHATALKQQVYALGEAGELSVDGVLKNDLEEIKDGIGDVMICVINWAHLSGADFIEAHEFMDHYARISCSESICVNIHSVLTNMTSTVAIGFLLEYLDILARNYNLTLEECLGHAYEVVIKRKIKFLNGVAIKDADWHKFPELAES